MELQNIQNQQTKEIKAIFNINSKSNPLVVDIDQSLANQLVNDGMNLQDQLFFSLQDFIAQIPITTLQETLNTQLIGTTEQFVFRDPAWVGIPFLLDRPIVNTNYEIGIIVESAVSFYNNQKIQTQIVQTIQPDFVTTNIYGASNYQQNMTKNFMQFRHQFTQISGIPINKTPQIKISFVIRNSLNSQEDNVFNSYRLVTFNNSYTIVFALY